MTPEGFYDQMHQKFLCWDFGAYTNKGRLIPVLKYIYIKNQAKEPQIKLEYYKSLDCNPNAFILSEYLDTKQSDEELVSIIEVHMRSDKWFEMPECFTGERLFSLELPVGHIKIEEWMERIKKSFMVESAGYGAVYQDYKGRRVSTATVFDFCVPAEQLDTVTWYKFCFESNEERELRIECIDKDHMWYENFFESDSENETRWHGFPHRYTNQLSLVLTGALGNWSFGISAYNSKSDPQLRDFYEVRYAPGGNGFLFRIDQEGIDRIWFKAAWLKSAGLDKNLCQQALRHWLA